MRILPFIIPSILALNINGRYDKGRFYPKRNKYFWRHNILPIKVEKAKLLSLSWKISESISDYNYYEDYNDFDVKLANKYNKFYKWTSKRNSDVIKSLIAIDINTYKKKFYILQILPNPYVDNFDIDMLDFNLNQLLFNENYFDYEISYRKLNK